MHNPESPSFSIITITLNNRKGLEKTYKSVAAQTVKNFEWVVIDGASTDGTIDFLKTQTSQIQRKTMSTEKDGGIYDAMNKGIKAARGDYVLFLNAGDELADAGVMEMLAPYTVKNPDFIYSDAMEGHPPKLKPARRYKDLPWGMFTHHQAMIYRRHTIRDLKLRYSILYQIAGDYDFTVRFLSRAKSLVRVPKPICIFEQGGVSQQNATLGRQEQYIIREELQVVSQTVNLWIYMVQSAAWRLKQASPGLYTMLKRSALAYMDWRSARKKAKKKLD